MDLNGKCNHVEKQENYPFVDLCHILCQVRWALSENASGTFPIRILKAPLQPNHLWPESSSLGLRDHCRLAPPQINISYASTAPGRIWMLPTSKWQPPLEVRAATRWGIQRATVVRMGGNQEYFRMQESKSVGLNDCRGLFHPKRFYDLRVAILEKMCFQGSNGKLLFLWVAWAHRAGDFYRNLVIAESCAAALSWSEGVEEAGWAGTMDVTLEFSNVKFQVRHTRTWQKGLGVLGHGRAQRCPRCEATDEAKRDPQACETAFYQRLTQEPLWKRARAGSRSSTFSLCLIYSNEKRIWQGTLVSFSSSDMVALDSPKAADAAHKCRKLSEIKLWDGFPLPTPALPWDLLSERSFLPSNWHTILILNWIANPDD